MNEEGTPSSVSIYHLFLLSTFRKEHYHEEKTKKSTYLYVISTRSSLDHFHDLLFSMVHHLKREMNFVFISYNEKLINQT